MRKSAEINPNPMISWAILGSVPLLLFLLATFGCVSATQPLSTVQIEKRTVELKFSEPVGARISIGGRKKSVPFTTALRPGTYPVIVDDGSGTLLSGLLRVHRIDDEIALVSFPMDVYPSQIKQAKGWKLSAYHRTLRDKRVASLYLGNRSKPEMDLYKPTVEIYMATPKNAEVRIGGRKFRTPFKTKLRVGEKEDLRLKLADGMEFHGYIKAVYANLQTRLCCMPIYLTDEEVDTLRDELTAVMTHEVYVESPQDKQIVAVELNLGRRRGK